MLPPKECLALLTYICHLSGGGPNVLYPLLGSSGWVRVHGASNSPSTQEGLRVFCHMEVVSG
jgi:hypothetical protein